MAGLSIYLLGPLRVTLDGQPVTSFGYDKVRALLAYLAMESQRPHRRETLAGILWPDQSEKAAHDSLRNALSRLRHAIGDQAAQPPYLIISKDSIQFNEASEAWLDMERFNQLLETCRTHRHRRIEACSTCTDRLIEAVNLYRGEFLDSFTLADSDLYEDWLQIHREKFRKMAMETFQQLASTYEWRDDPTKALIFTERQLELDPCYEEAYVQAMRLLGMMGKRTEACDMYENCREHLQNELEVEPSDETTRLYEQIKFGVFQVSPASQRLRINNLPPELTSFVGRERDLIEINALLEDPNCRMLSLVGPGGVGKTRLAIAAARRQLEAFPNGACFVALAGVSSVESIVPSILQALGLKQAEQGNLKQQLTNYLADKELILILDNFEHLIEGAGLVSELLEQATHLVTLVTSRQRLGLQVEWVFEVNGLSYPTGKDMQDLAAYEAVMLFQQRLHQVKPRTTLFQDDLSAVSRICQIVEGLPLGVELAASAVRRRSIKQVAMAIESGTEDLRVSYKDIPERHRSIRAVFEHSYRLLSQEEQSAFIGLAVFRGGFTAEAAEQVAGATPEILDALIEHSLARYEPEKERHDMHELVRQFAYEKLKASGGEGELKHRHSRYFLQALESWNIKLVGPEQTEALKEMDQELQDIRIAWSWACQQQDLEGLTKGEEGLCRFYNIHSKPYEGEHDCREALEQLESISKINNQARRIQIHLLAHHMNFLNTIGQNTISIRLEILENCLLLIEGLQSDGEDMRLERSWILRWISEDITNRESAIQIAQQSLDLARQTGNKHYQALALGSLTDIYFLSGKLIEAEHYCQDSLTIMNILGDPLITTVYLQNMAEITAHLGKLEVALQASKESAQILFALGGRVNHADGLSYMTITFYYSGQWEMADQYFLESLPYLLQMVEHWRLCKSYANWSMVKMFSGEYDEARVIVQGNIELAHQIDDRFSMMLNHYTLGGVSLARGQLEQAVSYLEKATNYCYEYGYPFFLAQVVGTWSIALNRLGKIKQAEDRMMQSLEKGVTLHSYTNLSFALPAAALLLAKTGQVERAVELCGLIHAQTMVKKSPWFEDIVGNSITGLAAALPPEVVEAARERGKQRDLFSTAAKLLEEFRDHP